MREQSVNLLIITPHRVGGVGTLVEALHELCKEDRILDCTIIDLSTRKTKFLHTYVNDLLVSMRLLSRGYFHVVLYLGGVSYISGIIAKLKRIPVALFVNGYVIHEIASDIRNAFLELDIRRVIAGIINLIWYRISGFIADIFIFPCYGTLENNRIPKFKPKIVIPLWLSKTRLQWIEKIKHQIKKEEKHRDFLIVTYLSNVESPKVIKLHQIIWILDQIHKRSSDKIKIVVINPRGDLDVKRDFVLVLKRLPWEEYVRLLAQSDLYIETILDDEFRYSTLEAMALGIPIAKITIPGYCDKIDLKHQLITCSINEFLLKVSDYIKNFEKFREDYVRIVTKYVYENRTWMISGRKLMFIIVELAKRYKAVPERGV